ncbi:hypothetical protein [uncultured Tenacibaculum sp.]|uniref:hypothetical protein n=1 Tax=uncultured Tenacibaculum sp. TaxID=174713 RepID=UPI002601C4BF|nr:hypothetical protein [uncultured Tenacibaculum sp.]
MGQKELKNYRVKKHSSVEVFYSETERVFFIKHDEKHVLNKHFKSLITCEEYVFNQFQVYLKENTKTNQPPNFSFKEIKNLLDAFFIKRGKNCKTRNYEGINKAS